MREDAAADAAIQKAVEEMRKRAAEGKPKKENDNAKRKRKS